MTHPITDPEEHLREAAVNYVRGPTSGTFGARDELYAAAAAYAESVGKSSSPEPAPRVEPPEEFRRLKWHWVEKEGELAVFRWHRGIDGVSQPSWTLAGDIVGNVADVVEYSDTADAASQGWRYHSPCLPDTRPSDTEVEQVDSEIEITDAMVWRGAAALDPKLFSADKQTARFAASPVTVEVARRDALAIAKRVVAKFDPTKGKYGVRMPWEIEAQTTPVQRVTDEEIEDNWRQGYEQCGFNERAFSFEDFSALVGALLAKHSPTITKQTLSHLYSLAKTRAPEQFKTEVRELLRGVGR